MSGAGLGAHAARRAALRRRVRALSCSTLRCPRPVRLSRSMPVFAASVRARSDACATTPAAATVTGTSRTRCKGPQMDPSGQHPARRAGAFAVQGLDHNLADAQWAVDGLDDALPGQVETHALCITLRARRLDHGSWSFFDGVSRQHPSQRRATSPSTTGSSRRTVNSRISQ